MRASTWLKKVFSAPRQPRPRYVGVWATVASGFILAMLGLLLFSALVNLWPAVDRSAQTASQTHKVTLLWGAYTAHLTKTTGLLVLVMVVGALGGYIHATTSFVSYVGNRTLKVSWMWWYAFRVFIGAALALLFYFAIRGGLFTGQASSQEINPYGVAAFAGLVGLFSKQATDKLKELFDTLFHVEEEGDHLRTDPLIETKPRITSLQPDSIPPGSEVDVRIEGQNFVQGAKVQFGDEHTPATFVSATQVSFRLTSADTAVARRLKVLVVNPDGATSEPRELAVEPAHV